eukprot:CAMPEP_0170537936 /NCGR_PEP_ID=MMETSP0209-20121228/103015_1 /TAXON_ID=665100 ORGANISM="Litonotus pictus, Strain P1" /NCGR_SAMPLE_ID=MMETSP0209 /ASSEMBLY_ACC=CAM_ASM_000301 /LENGTH=124 /DNA_ID=CAMNT_0010839533 /DNA_START=1827 /DNA_END=2198 /DNA_ORIENTATION=-
MAALDISSLIAVVNMKVTVYNVDNGKKVTEIKEKDSCARMRFFEVMEPFVVGICCCKDMFIWSTEFALVKKMTLREGYDLNSLFKIDQETVGVSIDGSIVLLDIPCCWKKKSIEVHNNNTQNVY